MAQISSYRMYGYEDNERINLSEFNRAKLTVAADRV